MSGRAAACCLVLCGACRLALAGGGAANDAYDDIDRSAPLDLHLFADVYVLHNFNVPDSQENQLREFDLYSDRPSLGYLRLTVARRPRRFGFRVDAGVGDTALTFRSEDPALPRHPVVARAFSYVEQAFVTVMIPTPRPIELDLGRFGTPVGLEDNESLTNWNYSRSLLYSWAEPSLHTGLRLTCELNDKVAATILWVNGWNSVFVDGNAMRSAGAAVSWKPSPALELVLVYLGGLEHPPTALDGPLHWRDIVASSIVYAVSPRVSFALAVDFGDDRASGGVYWWGLAGYARYQPRPWLLTTLRGEYLADPQGFVTGAPQQLAEATATVELAHRAGPLRLSTRLEYRHDQSNALVFVSGAEGLRARQDTLTLALLAAY